MTQAPGWTGIFEDGESILWQGRPGGRPRLTLPALKRAVPGVMLTLFALVWVGAAMGAPGLFWLFGLPFLAAGLWQMLRPVLEPALSARFSHYTLTDRRAFIARDLPLVGRDLHSWRITPDNRIDLIGGDDGAAGTVLFADGRLGGHAIPGPGGVGRVGFTDIDDARKVWELMRDIQQKDRLT